MPLRQGGGGNLVSTGITPDGVADVGDDRLRLGARAEDGADAKGLEGGDVISRDDAPKEHREIGEAPQLQFLHDARDKRHVRSGQDRQPDNVDVLLQRGLGDHCGRLPQPCIDDLHTGIAKRPRHDFGSSIVAIQAGFGNQHADRLCHVATSPNHSVGELPRSLYASRRFPELGRTVQFALRRGVTGPRRS